MEKNRYRPGMLLIAVLLIMGVQWFSMNAIQRDIDAKLQQVHEAVNTNSVLTTALIKVLEQKGVLEKQHVLEEAQQLSSDIKNMLAAMQQQKKQLQESRETSDNTTAPTQPQ